MTPERLLEHAAAVRVARNAERDRARRKLARLDRKVAGGHAHLKPFRDKTAAAAGAER